MNPFPDLYNNMQTPPTPSMFGDVNTNTAFIPNSFPTPIVDNNSADLIGNWPSLSETDLLAAAGVAGTGTNIPMSSPFTNTSSPAGTVPNMMDNQQAQMVMMMMQQQQEQQQQQQMLLRQQQQQQQQLLMQKRAAAQAQAQAQAMNQQQQQPPPWFLKQQQTKMMAAQTQQTQQVPSPNNSYSVSNSSSPMHVHQQSPLLNMDQQSQQSPAVQANIMNQSAVGTPILPSSSVASPNIVTDTADLALLAKRVEVILTLNQELIRLCLEHQQMNGNELREPNLTAYQGKLQSNLTYLATMADISMTKLEDNFKIPSPPDLTPLPPPYTLTGQRIHKLLGTAIGLFPPSAAQPAQPPNKRLNSNTAELDMSPYPQQQQQQQLQRAKQQQYQQQMQQQQHMMMMRQQQYMLIKQQQQQQQNGGANSMSSPQFLNQQQLGLSGPIVDNNSDMMTSMNMNNGGQPSNYSSPSSTSNNLGMDDMTMMMMYNNNN